MEITSYPQPVESEGRSRIATSKYELKSQVGITRQGRLSIPALTLEFVATRNPTDVESEPPEPQPTFGLNALPPYRSDAH